MDRTDLDFLFLAFVRNSQKLGKGDQDPMGHASGFSSAHCNIKEDLAEIVCLQQRGRSYEPSLYCNLAFVRTHRNQTAKGGSRMDHVHKIGSYGLVFWFFALL